jgi:predicted phage tail protein
MIKLTIYGRLRKFIGQSTFEIKANSAKEAFSFLIHNFNGVKKHMQEQEYCVMAGEVKITEELFDMQTKSDIKIIPVVHGEILPFLLGAGLVGAGAVAATFTNIAFISGTLATALTVTGVNMIVSGVVDLITAQPRPPQISRQEDPQDPSYTFTGLLNNTKQGVPINIIYGETLVGSTVVSSSVDTFQVVNSA